MRFHSQSTKRTRTVSTRALPMPIAICKIWKRDILQDDSGANIWIRCMIHTQTHSSQITNVKTIRVEEGTTSSKVSTWASIYIYIMSFTCHKHHRRRCIYSNCVSVFSFSIISATLLLLLLPSDVRCFCLYSRTSGHWIPMVNNLRIFVFPEKNTISHQLE